MSRITVLRSTASKADKGYTIVELAYKTEDGKTKGMKIFGFGPQKEVAEVAKAAKAGEVLEAVFQQNQKGYWEFASLKSTGEVVGASVPTGGGSTGGASRSNWETSEERAARQVLIVRQSSLSTAVNFCEVAKIKPNVDDVIGYAKMFEDYVMGKAESKQLTGDIE